MQQFNKATAAVIAGAVVTIIGSLVSLDPTLTGALQTVITAGLVFLVPNAKAE